VDYLGWNLPLLLAQLLNLAILTFWLTLAILALRRLGELDMGSGVRLGWAALALLVPILGALAVLVANPRRRQAG
jgi:hypothetical protein